MRSSTIDDLRNSLLDGLFANMFAVLTGGVFLTGFALYLGMDEFMIGLLASMPYLVTVFQLPTAYVIDREGGRKRLCSWAAGIARGMWMPIMIVALLPLSSSSIKASIVLGLVFSSYVLVSVSYVSWLSWISDLVPEGSRGSFFGARNMLNGAAGMLAMVLFGHLLDYLKSHSGVGLPIGFGLTFTAAVLFGMVSLHFLKRISEPSIGQPVTDRPFNSHVTLPFKDVNFRRFAAFAFIWSLSVYFASPFFTLYFLRELKFSYGFVATLGMLSALTDLIGMRVWGRISDRVRNKPIIRVASWVAAFLPVGWVTVSPGSVAVPILLHIVGGGVWAGIHLCMNNLLLRISPQENRAAFLSTYNVLAGLGAASGPILSGLLLRSISALDIQLFSREVLPLQVVFLISTLLRLLSLQFFRYVQEPGEVSVGQMVRIIRSVRGLNVASGFSFLLHPFIELAGRRPRSYQ